MSIEYYHIRDLDILTKVDDFVPYFYNKKNNKWEVDQEDILLDRMSELDTSLDLITEEEALKMIESNK